VSGQNVMLLAALALPLLGMARAGPRVRTGVMLGLIAVYVPLAGAGPSLQRAGIMGAAAVVAIAAARPASRSYALALAAAATLAVNPLAAGDPGWQLSFSAVAGILWLAPALRAGLRWLPGVLAEGAAITVAATLVTAPLIAYHFDRVPLAGLPANLLALPAVPVVMWGGMLLCALGQIPLGLAERVSGAIGWVAGPAVDYLAWLARTFAELPGGGAALPLRTPAAVVAAYGLLAATALLVRRRGGAAAGAGRATEVAAAVRRLPARRRLVLFVVLAAAPSIGFALALRPPGTPARLTVRFLDVGQGDATLVQHPDGSAVLFDGGPPEARSLRLLRAAGVRRLAVVVATHASRDHHGGLLEVVERMPVDVLLDGGDGTYDRGFRAVVAAAREAGTRVVPATAPVELAAGGLDIRVLSPPPRPAGPAPEDPNPRAVVALVSSGSFDLLLSSDAESEALAPLALPDVDAIKVPHHGSSDPGLPDILGRLKPEAAAIEVGDNDYGHPAPSTLRALRAAGVPTWRTDRHGTVTLTAGRDGLHVATER
jgi:competence protein ComEC